MRLHGIDPNPKPKPDAPSPETLTLTSEARKHPQAIEATAEVPPPYDLDYARALLHESKLELRPCRCVAAKLEQDQEPGGGGAC